MNIKEILESKDSIQELIGKSMPIKTAFAVSKLQKELNIALELYDSRKQGMFDKYGENSEAGKKIKEEYISTYISEHNELIEEELDILFDKVSIDTLGDIQIAPAHLTNLSWLLE